MTTQQVPVPVNPPFVTESVILPALFLSRENIRRLYVEARDRTVAEARAAMGASVRLIVRGMLPSDIGETNEQWADQTATTTNAYENTIIATQSVADQRFLGIYGLVYYGQQVVRAIRWTVKSRLMAHWDLSAIISDDTRLDARTAYALSPFTIPQNISVTIAQYVNLPAAVIYSTEIAYLGITVEKAGRTIDV